MLAKKFRLQIQKQNPVDFKKAIGGSGKYFFLKTAKNEFSYGRFGAVINKGVDKSSVKRNRIKRIVFDFIRLKKIYLLPGKDFLIIVSPPARNLKKMEIKKELTLLFNKEIQKLC